MGIPVTSSSGTMKVRERKINGFLLLAEAASIFTSMDPAQGLFSWCVLHSLPMLANGITWLSPETVTPYMIFVDGVPVGSEVNTVAIPNANAPLTIGQAKS